VTRTVRKWGLALVLAVVGLEGLLQLGAWLVWRNSMLGPEGPPRAHTVLVSGGSSVFEDGIDSVEQAWPAEAAALLRSKFADVELVNVGMRRSAFGLRVPALGEQMMMSRPEVVVLALGTDDLSRMGPTPVALGDLPPRLLPFPFRWRIPTLFPVESASDDAAFDQNMLLGRWSAGGVDMWFDPGGRIRFADKEGWWGLHEGKLRMMLPGTEFMDITHQQDALGERLTCRFVTSPTTLVVERSKGVGGFLGGVETAIESGRLAEARWLLNSAIAGPAPSPGALASLVELDAIEGRFDAAAALVERLERAVAESPAAQRDLARAYLALGRCREAVDAALSAFAVLVEDRMLVDRLARMPDRAEFTRLLAALESQGESTRSAVVALREAATPAGLGERERAALLADLDLALRMIAHFGAAPLIALGIDSRDTDPVWDSVQKACEGRVEVIVLPTTRAGRISVLHAALERRFTATR
jgi:hypothetical protein